MKHHLIINPASAGGKTAHREAAIRQAAARFLGLTEEGISVTGGPGHATELARTSLLRGAESILVAGGDGTVNEVINGFFSADGKALGNQPCLGLIPSGSGGDFRRTFSIENTIEAGFSTIARRELQPIDLGLVVFPDGSRRFFANVASAGLSADIGIRTSQARRLKRVSAALAYNWCILSTALMHQRYPLLLKTPGGLAGREVDANCVAVCNGRFFGGGIPIAPDAHPGDGSFEVVIVHGRGPLGFLRGVAAIKKDPSVQPDGLSRESAAWVELSSAAPGRQVRIEADGEFAGCLPARFEIVPAAARIFC